MHRFAERACVCWLGHVTRVTECRPCMCRSMACCGLVCRLPCSCDWAPPAAADRRPLLLVCGWGGRYDMMRALTEYEQIT